MARWLAKTAARGYGGQHQKLRAQWKPTVDAGHAWCTEVICLQPTRWIPPGTPWHLAHTPDRGGYRGPAHEQCNIAEVNRRRSDARRRARPPVRTVPLPLRTSRRW